MIPKVRQSLITHVRTFSTGPCGVFLFFFLNETMDRVRQHTQMHTLSKLCSPSVPLCMQLLRGLKTSGLICVTPGCSGQADPLLYWPVVWEPAFDRKLGDKLNRWLDKKLAVQNSSRRIFWKITLPWLITGDLFPGWFMKSICLVISSQSFLW